MGKDEDETDAEREVLVPSQSSFPDTENDDTEKIVKWEVDSEHALVVGRIREETQNDPKIQKIAKRIAKAD